MPPEQLVTCAEFLYIRDAIDEEEALLRAP
jgi:hypothetical protein